MYTSIFFGYTAPLMINKSALQQIINYEHNQIVCFKFDLEKYTNMFIYCHKLN